MDNDFLAVESIQERDIDFLLLEELRVNNAFCEWFLGVNKLPEMTDNYGAWRSINAYGLGETDVLFKYSSNGQVIFILIENKLDAQSQKKQYERYIKRAKKYVLDESCYCDQAFVVLAAPQAYYENQNKFKVCVSYEQIAEQFELLGDKRSQFKSQLFRIASKKLRRGYQAVNEFEVQQFWMLYWKFRANGFPHLVMKKPEIVPQNSDWPILKVASLDKVVFYHKLSNGYIDANIHSRHDSLKKVLEENLPEDYSLVTHGASFSIRVAVDSIDRTKSFESQQEKVNRTLIKLDELAKWMKQF